MHANNEIGTVQPVADLAAIAHGPRRPVPHRRRPDRREGIGGRTIGRTTAAVMEANETYRVSQNTIIQIATPMSVATGVNAKSAPAEVATPFPPLNLSHGGYKCPRTLEHRREDSNYLGRIPLRRLSGRHQHRDLYRPESL